MINWIPSHETLYTVSGLFLFCAVGLFKIVKVRRHFRQRRTFANEFREKFSKYVNNPVQELPTFNWIIANSPQMQIEMGNYAIYSHFRDARGEYTNYPIIMNIPLEIRLLFDGIPRHGNLFQSHLNQYISMVDQAILRYFGYLDFTLKNSLSDLRNPVIWFREGIRVAIASPLSLLHWLGVLSAATVSRLTGHSAFKALAGIASVIGFVSAIFGIVTG